MATVETDPEKIEQWQLEEECKRMGICYVCRAPVLAGQPLYGPRQAHYYCVEPTLPLFQTRAELDELIKKGDESMARLKRAVRDFTR